MKNKVKLCIPLLLAAIGAGYVYSSNDTFDETRNDLSDRLLFGVTYGGIWQGRLRITPWVVNAGSKPILLPSTKGRDISGYVIHEAGPENTFRINWGQGYLHNEGMQYPLINVIGSNRAYTIPPGSAMHFDEIFIKQELVTDNSLLIFDIDFGDDNPAGFKKCFLKTHFTDPFKN